MEDVISRAAREALGDTARRCTATNRAGERCGRTPIPGGFVCAMHGGKNPVVQKTARERLLAMVDPALDALLRFLRTAPPCEVCGRSDADRDPLVLRAAQLVLDRTGFHPSVDVQMKPPERDRRHFAWIPTARLEQMMTWGQQMVEWETEAKAAMEAGDLIATDVESLPSATTDAPVVDAVLVEGTAPDATTGDEQGPGPVRA